MSSIVISGDTSGTITLDAPAVAGTNTITLPATTGTMTVMPSGFTLGAGNTSAFKNRLINGAFTIAQRGTSFTSTDGANNDDTYNLDRWYVLSDGNDVVDITQSTDAPANGLYSIGLDVETINKKFGIAQIIENINCYDAINGNVTLSFQARVSSTTKLDNIKCAVIAWSGTVDTVTSDIISAWGAEGTNPTLIANATYENTPANLNVTTSWATYSVTANVDTANTKNIIVFIWSDVTDTTLGDFLYITNVQLEEGQTASSFDYRSIQTELAMCQRYAIVYGRQQSYNEIGGTGFAFSTTQVDVPVNVPVEMRTIPAVTVSGNIQVSDGAVATAITSLTLQTTQSSTLVTSIRAVVSSGLTTFRPYRIETANSTTAFVLFSSEL